MSSNSIFNFRSIIRFFLLFPCVPYFLSSIFLYCLTTNRSGWWLELKSVVFNNKQKISFTRKRTFLYRYLLQSLLNRPNDIFWIESFMPTFDPISITSYFIQGQIHMDIFCWLKFLIPKILDGETLLMQWCRQTTAFDTFVHWQILGSYHYIVCQQYHESCQIGLL